MGFRKDINGLRAIAVLAVVVFHFNPTWLKGGFTGVDVFFVISGYLMTSIIFRGIKSNSFSFVKFYLARAKRIIPALVVLCLLLLAYGWLFLPPIPYYDLAKHSGASVLFISNFTYWSESGYFDASSLEKLLLHTWSLSVEWQFYILYPVALIVLSKFISKDNLKKSIAGLALVGFAFSAYASHAWPTASYFLLPSRAWEMMIGGVAFLYPMRIDERNKKWVEIASLVVILFAYFRISNEVSWPGYLALLPTLGAFFLIQADNQKSILTGNVVFQKIGVLSYSIYLVHWPVIVIYKKYDFPVGFLTYLLVVLLLSLSLYYVVEKRRMRAGIMAAMLLVACSVSWIVINTEGVKHRVPEHLRLTKEEYHAKYYGGAGYPHNGSVLRFGKREDSLAYILTGDSFARQYGGYIKDSKLNLVATFKDGCISTRDYFSKLNNKNDLQCLARADNLLPILKQHPDAPLIVAHSWSSYEGKVVSRVDYSPLKVSYSDFLVSEIEKIKKTHGSSRNIYLIGMPNGSGQYNSFECMASSPLAGYKIFAGNRCVDHVSKSHKGINQTLKEYSLGVKSVYFIDPNDILCKNNKCMVSSKGNNPIYSDKAHLSKHGAKIVGDYIFSIINQIESKG